MVLGTTTIEVVRGSVTDQPVDMIVNAANKSMRGGGGIDGRIHSLAGPAMMDELVQAAPHGAHNGEPILTQGYNLPQKFVIHVAGPRWGGGTHGESEDLAACYANSLALADSKSLAGIAFCSISTGIYGFPIEQAAPLAIQTVRAYLQKHSGTNLRRVIFALYGAEEFAVFMQAFKKAAEGQS